ncbi:MAG: dihydrofolate reductase [Betaproteobacteria bacterium]|nr:dihydrofolate reductase [Betaproteobacteria bacterium]
MDDTLLAADSPRTPGAGAAPSAQLSVIAAVARNGVIGAGNRMPWHLPADLGHFRALTMGHRIIMGRKTWESLGRPLPGRENVIVSRNAGLVAPGCKVVPDLAAALAGCALPPPTFCIGGAALYRIALPLADAVHLTEIDADFAGDTLMPPLAAGEWSEISRERGTDAASGLAYSFVKYVRIKAPA